MGQVVVIGIHFQCRHHSHYLLPVEQEEDSESDDDTDQLIHQTCIPILSSNLGRVMCDTATLKFCSLEYTYITRVLHILLL